MVGFCETCLSPKFLTCFFLQEKNSVFLARKKSFFCLAEEVRELSQSTQECFRKSNVCLKALLAQIWNRKLIDVHVFCMFTYSQWPQMSSIHSLCLYRLLLCSLLKLRARVQAHVWIPRSALGTQTLLASSTTGTFVWPAFRRVKRGGSPSATKVRIVVFSPGTLWIVHCFYFFCIDFQVLITQKRIPNLLVSPLLSHRRSLTVSLDTGGRQLLVKVNK